MDYRGDFNYERGYSLGFKDGRSDARFDSVAKLYDAEELEECILLIKKFVGTGEFRKGQLKELLDYHLKDLLDD